MVFDNFYVRLWMFLVILSIFTGGLLAVYSGGMEKLGG